MALGQLIYISVQLTIKFNSTQFRLYSYTKFDLLVLGAVKIFRWLHRKRLKAIHYFHKELHIRCGRSRSLKTEILWLIIGTIFQVTSSKLRYFCKKSQLVIVGAGEILRWIPNVFIFRKNFLIGAIWW